MASGGEWISRNLGYKVLKVHPDIVDATNSTLARRKMILERVHEIEDLNVLFIESICTDKKVLPDCFYPVYCIVDFGEQYETEAFWTRLQRYSSFISVLMNGHGPGCGSRRFQTTCCEL